MNVSKTRQTMTKTSAKVESCFSVRHRERATKNIRKATQKHKRTMAGTITAVEKHTTQSEKLPARQKMRIVTRFKPLSRVVFSRRRTSGFNHCSAFLQLDIERGVT
jgi:hypothetical protein